MLDQYIGSNPFDWLGDETSLGLGTAMYDLMGKAAGVPVYKLFGQKYRSWVPVAAWTVSTHPDRMARAVSAYARQGHTWMKFHLSPFENVIDRTEAMQKVAPKGFKLHYDFTMQSPRVTACTRSKAACTRISSSPCNTSSIIWIALTICFADIGHSCRRR